MTQQLLEKSPDQCIVLTGTWENFKLIQAGLADSPGIKLGYYNGAIELLMPGFQHENFSEIIGYLITTFLLSQGIVFVPSGSMTQEKEGEVSTQADKSYCFDRPKPIPDLAIEVIFTSGSVKKLARYRALEVPEVWFWEDGVLTLHRLRSLDHEPPDYEPVERSELPGLDRLDIDLLRRCILLAETDFLTAVQTFQKAINPQ